MSLNNKIDFAVIFTVTHANPNGDPLNGNRPRTTMEGLGEVSDVCLKRKIRDRLMEAGIPVFVQSADRCVDGYKTLKERAENTLDLKGKPDPKEQAAKACEAWYDVRAFGQVFAYADKGGKAGNGISIGVRGPVSIHPAFTQESVCVTSTQITKSVSSEGDGTKKSSDTMGMKHRVDRGVYTFFGAISPQLAEQTGFSDDDAQTLKSILPKMFEGDASSARPEGSMAVLHVFWWKHSCPAGQYSSAKVHRSLTVHADGSYSLSPLDNLEPEIIEGF